MTQDEQQTYPIPGGFESPPILSYDREQAAVRAWNPRGPAAAAYVISILRRAYPALQVEHIGSSAIPGCDGKGILDLLLLRHSDEELAHIRDLLRALGFQPQPGPKPWPESRPCRVGRVIYNGEPFRIHAHVVPHDSPEVAGLRHFRDWLTHDDEARAAYVAAKRGITGDAEVDPDVYSASKAVWVDAFLRERAEATPAEER